MILLYADDDDLLRGVLSKLLRQHGHEVLEAQSGEQALPLVAGARPDVLITDISMPGAIDGWRLAKECRALLPELLVVYTSSSAENAAEMVANSFYFRKPYQPQLLAMSVHGLTRNMPRQSYDGAANG